MAAAQTIKVYILLAPVPLMLDFAGPVEVLRRANKIQDQIRFDVEYISVRNEMMSSAGIMLSGLSPLPDTLPDNSYLMVSGTTDDTIGTGSIPSAQDTQADKTQIINWLRRTFTNNQTLLTVCSGALLAARAGLFEGYRCTSHHDCIDELAAISPNIRVEENRLFTEDRGRSASAGVTSGTDMMLHIVGRILGVAAAADIAKHMVVYLRRTGNEPQLSPFLDGRSHLHPTIHRIQDMIASDPTDNWTVERLANSAYMSVRHFSRLFNKETGYSVPDYVNGLRIAIAENALRARKTNIESLVGDLGFSSSRHFRRAWQKHHDASPTEWRRQMLDAANG